MDWFYACVYFRCYGYCCDDDAVVAAAVVVVVDDPAGFEDVGVVTH